MEINPRSIEKTFEVEIEGTKPLLMHNPTRSMACTEEWKAKGANCPPRDVQAESGLYLNAKGEVIVPALVLLGMLRSGAADKKVGGKGKSTYKKLVYSGLEIDGSEEPRLKYDKWQIDSRFGRIGGRTGGVMINRPRFDQWSLVFRIRVCDPVFLNPSDQGPQIIQSILENAGRRGGLCDFRPLFGQFKVAKITEVKPQ